MVNKILLRICYYIFPLFPLWPFLHMQTMFFGAKFSFRLKSACIMSHVFQKDYFKALRAETPFILWQVLKRWIWHTLWSFIVAVFLYVRLKNSKFKRKSYWKNPFCISTFSTSCWCFLKERKYRRPSVFLWIFTKILWHIWEMQLN